MPSRKAASVTSRCGENLNSPAFCGGGSSVSITARERLRPRAWSCVASRHCFANTHQSYRKMYALRGGHIELNMLSSVCACGSRNECSPRCGVMPLTLSERSTCAHASSHWSRHAGRWRGPLRLRESDLIGTMTESASTCAASPLTVIAQSHSPRSSGGGSARSRLRRASMDASMMCTGMWKTFSPSSTTNCIGPGPTLDASSRSTVMRSMCSVSTSPSIGLERMHSPLPLSWKSSYGVPCWKAESATHWMRSSVGHTSCTTASPSSRTQPFLRQILCFHFSADSWPAQSSTDHSTAGFAGVFGSSELIWIE
mmetsp:Transcript_50391/g.148755  ORF Transcript_50391/g.148755 Transcript_50391/m.148755 type:complete len:312 (+) Transcript_50391:774-1709(+)